MTKKQHLVSTAVWSVDIAGSCWCSWCGVVVIIVVVCIRKMQSDAALPWIQRQANGFSSSLLEICTIILIKTQHRAYASLRHVRSSQDKHLDDTHLPPFSRYSVMRSSSSWVGHTTQKETSFLKLAVQLGKGLLAAAPAPALLLSAQQKASSGTLVCPQKTLPKGALHGTATSDAWCLNLIAIKATWAHQSSPVEPSVRSALHGP